MVVVLFTTLFCIYLYSGIYVLRINIRNLLNQYFFVITIFLSVVCISSILIQINDSEPVIYPLYLVGASFYNSTWMLLLLFQIEFTKIVRLKWYGYTVLLIPTIYIILLPLIRHFQINFVYLDTVWYSGSYNKNDYNSLTQISIIFLIYILLSFLVLIAAYRKSKSAKLKKQIRILLITLLLSFFIAFIDHGILYTYGIWEMKIPGIVVCYSTIWLFGMWYCLIKFRFMAVTPESVSNEILSNIEDLVILLSSDFRILTLNLKARELLKFADNSQGIHFSHFLPDFKKIETEIVKLNHENSSSLSCRIHFTDTENEKLLMNSKFKQLKDKYGELLGYLIIANQVKEIKQLWNNYNITERESDVIQLIIAGKTNHEIGNELKITERTVKSHITHIFNKLCVDNRIQLMLLLKDFNLLPEHSADKILFIKNDYK